MKNEMKKEKRHTKMQGDAARGEGTMKVEAGEGTHPQPHIGYYDAGKGHHRGENKNQNQKKNRHNPTQRPTKKKG